MSKSTQKRREAKQRRRAARKRKREGKYRGGGGKTPTATPSKVYERVAKELPASWADMSREEAKATMSDSEYFYWQLGHPGEPASEEQIEKELEERRLFLNAEEIESYREQRRKGIEKPVLYFPDRIESID